jgi:hypothetical protein
MSWNSVARDGRDQLPEHFMAAQAGWKIFEPKPQRLLPTVRR